MVTVDDNAAQPNSVETDTFEVAVVNANPNAANDFFYINEDGTAVTGNALINDGDSGGTVSIDYTLSDGRGGMDTASVGILINMTNPPPTPRDDSIAADEEVAVNGVFLPIMVLVPLAIRSP